MGYEELNNLERLVLDDIRRLNEVGEIKPQDYPRVKDAVCILKEVSEIREGNNMPTEYSGNHYPTYYDNVSYRRGRDTMGRYTSGNWGDMNYSGRNANHEIIQTLKQKMAMTANENDRQSIQRTITMLEME